MAMRSIFLKRSLMIAPVVLGAFIINSSTAHADYTLDPRFTGNPDMNVVTPLSQWYTFQHGILGSPYAPPMQNGVYVGGYWSGKIDFNGSYKFISMDKMVMLSANFHGSQNTATNVGGGFYDGIFIGPNDYQTWTQSGVSQPERKASYDYGPDLIKKVSTSNRLIYGAIHYNRSTSMDGSNYKQASAGLPANYIVSANSNGDFIPFNMINRSFNVVNGHEAMWLASPFNSVQVKAQDVNIKWLNNTTTATSVNWNHNINASNVAPSGAYNINSNFDSDRKVLSWTTGDQNNRYFTTGDKVVFRNMSPIIQDGGKNGGLNKFRSNQVFRQSVWVPDDFSYKAGDARLYAIQKDGSRIDVTNRADIFYGSTGGDYVSNWSDGTSTKTNMRRVLATIKDIHATGTGDYNNANTVGYSFMVPTTVGPNAHTDKPYGIRGGSQILNGIWHDTGNDHIRIWRPSAPASTPSTSNAVVYNNGSASDLNENRQFYDGTQFANNKTFRTNEFDGYFVWHTTKATAPVPDEVNSNKGSASSIDRWQYTKPLVVTIPYNSQYVKPVTNGAIVTRGGSSFRVSVGTNGITGQDTGSAYVVTIPATLLNATRTTDQNWGVAMKYKVNAGIPGAGAKITSQATTVDDASGTQKANVITNYVTTPSNASYMTTLQPDGQTERVWYNVNANDSVHFVNGQQLGYSGAFYRLSAMNGSSGVGEPIKKLTMKSIVKAGQTPTDVYVSKNSKVIWHGHITNDSDTLVPEGVAGIGGISKSDMTNAFTAKISNSDNKTASNTSMNATQTIDVSLNDNLRNDKTALYDSEDDIHVTVVVKDDDAANKTNLTNTYGEIGNPLAGTLSLSNGLVGDTTNNLSQRVSRVRPGGMLMKHDEWQANATASTDGSNLNNSSVQAREVYDYRLGQFLGNASLTSEAYGTPFVMKMDAGTASSVEGSPVVKAYGLDGSVVDATNDFDISVNGKVVTASMKSSAVNQVGNKAGQVYNKLYILSVPLKNQQDTPVTVKNEIKGWSTINGQELPVNLTSEFIPPETPIMYGYTATSDANRFDPKNPEKDKGKIAPNTLDGRSVSSQISTAPIQWVLREQLGDMTGAPQKYDYDKFTAEFANIGIFQNTSTPTWSVYDENGNDVSRWFTGAVTSGQGYKISANKEFLSTHSRYGHKYYFVLTQSTQNSRKNRIATNAVLGLMGLFNNIYSSLAKFAGIIGIGNTTKTAAIPEVDIQYPSNLLQINDTLSNLNEKTAQLNDVGFNVANAYNINNVTLNHTQAGYTVKGAAVTFSDLSRDYDSNTATFSASTSGNVNSSQRITPGSVKVMDTINNQDVTNEYNITIKDGEKVSVEAKPEAIKRLGVAHSVQGVNNSTNATDFVTFHVDTWGDRSTPTTVTWIATQTINGYEDAKSIERVTIPKAHGGKKELFVSPAGQNKWQSTDYTLKKPDDLVDLKIRMTVPNDLHNKDFNDFIIHHISSEITPFLTDASATATVTLGDNNDRNTGAKMTKVSTSVDGKSLNDSRVVWELPDTIVTQLNTTDALDKMPTYTVIIRDVSMLPTASRTVDQYIPYLEHATDHDDPKNPTDVVKIPVGGVSTADNGQKAPLDGQYLEGRSGALVDPTIGSIGSGTTLGANSGKINIIMPQETFRQEAFVNGRESNTSFTGKTVTGK